MRPPSAQADGRAIRAILLDVWDPIGIAGIPEAADEYDAYIWPILTLLLRGASAADLTEHLVRIAVEHMGLGEQRLRAAAAADALRELSLLARPDSILPP